ncbi:MAG: PhzF family phenazine biosynthesis protein [Acidobacteriota bacterium]
MSVPLFHVDAFTERPFGGNPAAVCVLPDERPDAWMQSVAGEMNLSETAFLRRTGDVWPLRWFTPALEVDLCGHATLASAHVLWQAGYEKPDAPIVFETKSGRLTARRRDAAAAHEIQLDFPAEPASPCEPPDGLLEALGIASPRFAGRNRFDFFFELPSESDVRALTPDFRRIVETAGPARGVIVTAPASGRGYDFVSRYFAPAYGIDEDPVTGSAHCCLGPHWAGRLGRTELTGYQASRRGGTVFVRVGGDRVSLGGQAVTIARGELL